MRFLAKICQKKIWLSNIFVTGDMGQAHHNKHLPVAIYRRLLTYTSLMLFLTRLPTALGMQLSKFDPSSGLFPSIRPMLQPYSRLQWTVDCLLE
jgi:hypothetical protein